MIKYFRFSYDYLMWDIGYINIVMLMASIPVYDPEEDKKEKEEIVNVGDDIQSIGSYLNNVLK